MAYRLVEVPRLSPLKSFSQDGRSHHTSSLALPRKWSRGKHVDSGRAVPPELAYWSLEVHNFLWSYAGLALSRVHALLRVHFTSTSVAPQRQGLQFGPFQVAGTFISELESLY